MGFRVLLNMVVTITLLELKPILSVIVLSKALELLTTCTLSQTKPTLNYLKTLSSYYSIALGLTFLINLRFNTGQLSAEHRRGLGTKNISHNSLSINLRNI
jgi:hypothetical protein